MRIYRSLKVLSFVVVLAAGLALATEAGAQSVSGSIANGKVTRGKTARATVVLDIPAELHTNSNKPGSEYAIPTTVKASAAGVKIGAVRYPPGHDKKFEFSEDSLSVYEGRVEFTFDVTVPRSYKGSNLDIDVSVRYQACTNEVCYPPKTRKVVLTAEVN